MNQPPRGEGSGHTSQIITLFLRSVDPRTYLDVQTAVQTMRERIADGLFPLDVTETGGYECEHYTAASQAPRNEWTIPFSCFPAPMELIKPYFPHLFRPWAA